MAAQAAARLWRPLAGVARSMGASGTLAALTGLITSPTGRSLVTKTVGAIGKALGWVARKAYSGVDRALRLFGRPGHKAADALFAGVVSLGGKLAAVAAPVVHRVARLSDPATTHVRLLSGLCQSFVTHKLLKAVVPNKWVRVLVEAVLVPAVLDSRLWEWARRTLQQLRGRARSLREQAQALVDLERPDTVDGEQLPFDDGVDTFTPSNRAERRAVQRQAQRSHR